MRGHKIGVNLMLLNHPQQPLFVSLGCLHQKVPYIIKVPTTQHVKEHFAALILSKLGGGRGVLFGSLGLHLIEKKLARTSTFMNLQTSIYKYQSS